MTRRPLWTAFVAVTGLLASTSPALGVGAVPEPGLGRVRMTVARHDVIEVEAPVNVAGRLSAVCEFGKPGKHYEVQLTARADHTYSLHLAPTRSVEQAIEHRGHLSVLVTVALHQQSGALTETTPKPLVLRRR
jgi:hypothetical protein